MSYRETRWACTACEAHHGHQAALIEPGTMRTHLEEIHGLDMNDEAVTW